jgi:hypothetical protein
MCWSGHCPKTLQSDHRSWSSTMRPLSSRTPSRDWARCANKAFCSIAGVGVLCCRRIQLSILKSLWRYDNGAGGARGLCCSVTGTFCVCIVVSCWLLGAIGVAAVVEQLRREAKSTRRSRASIVELENGKGRENNRVSRRASRRSMPLYAPFREPDSAPHEDITSVCAHLVPCYIVISCVRCVSPLEEASGWSPHTEVDVI